MTRPSRFGDWKFGARTQRLLGRLGLPILLACLLLIPQESAFAQSGSGPLLAGGGGPMVELLLIDTDELKVEGLPAMVLLQGGGGFGRYQAWRVGGAGAAGQATSSDGTKNLSLSYGGVHFAYLPGAHGALPLASPRTSFGALFGMGAASLQQADDSSTKAFILFRPEATFEFALGDIGTAQVGASYTFPIPLGDDDGPLGDLRAIQSPALRAGLVFGGF